jgi:hypothetical protein
MARKPRTADELQTILPHVSYEWAMLKGTIALLATTPADQTVLVNALIESCTIHARALMAFLYPGARHPDDVLAEDFFVAGDWERQRPPAPPEFGPARNRVNKEIAHLTYTRRAVTPEIKSWELVSLGNAILRIMDIFFGALPPHLHPANCATSLAPAKVVLGKQSYTTQDISPTY